jgi:hypothetical protein
MLMFVRLVQFFERSVIDDVSPETEHTGNRRAGTFARPTGLGIPRRG